MKKRSYYWFWGLLGVMAALLVSMTTQTLAQTSSPEIKLVTGNELGEYYSVGKDIEQLASQNNLDIDVIPTRGALQNVHDVFNYNSISLAITQSDVLAFLNTFANNDQEIRLQADSLRTLLPLYQEPIHLITRQDIDSVQDLAGKKISIGDEGSGTSMTASTLLYEWEVQPQELFTYDIKRGIDALRDKEIDALFYVVGVPSKVLQEQIFPEDNFQILPINLRMKPEDDFYSRLYSEITMPADTYSWLTQPVKTLAVQSFLITTEQKDCSNVTPVAKLIKDNLSWLQKNGDPVWRGVNLDVMEKNQTQRRSKCSIF